MINSRLITWSSFFLAALFTLWFIRVGRDNAFWWGGPASGPLGLISFVVPSLFIWYQLMLHNMKGNVAVMFAVTLLRPGRVHPVLFHEDNAYGLGGVMRCCYLSFQTTLLHTAAVLAMVKGGYLQQSSRMLFVVLSALFVIFFPLFVALPLRLLNRAVRRFRTDLLAQLRSLSTDELAVLGEARAGRADRIEAARRLSVVAALEGQIRKQPTNLLGGIRVGIGLVGWILQVAAAILTFYQVFG